MDFGGIGRGSEWFAARGLLSDGLFTATCTVMRHTFNSGALGAMRQAMIERDLAHIEHVLLGSHASARDNSAFPPSYWHERLRRIKDGGQLWGVHLRKIDTLQRILNGALPDGYSAR